MSVGIVHVPINTVTRLIPNSQLVFYPTLPFSSQRIPSNKPLEKEEEEEEGSGGPHWPYQLILNPSRYWYFHLIFLGMSLLCLGILALVLQWIENRENIKERVYLL
ncbi:hypothetical protein HMI55_005012 [Coelomomyces lativittatus]|nr:hypothetical protein HMI56_005321 [Coelomomyces lativittatus]KAJ1498278.1 hypothetical protein HMI55_005012 [Coelomomyces lativittatus]